LTPPHPTANMTPVTNFIVQKISGVRFDTVVIIANGRLEWI
jgi:hypothetical protein